MMLRSLIFHVPKEALNAVVFVGMSIITCWVLKYVTTHAYVCMIGLVLTRFKMWVRDHIPVQARTGRKKRFVDVASPDYDEIIQHFELKRFASLPSKLSKLVLRPPAQGLLEHHLHNLYACRMQVALILVGHTIHTPQPRCY